MIKHWIWLTTRKGIGTHGVAELLRLFGTAERIYALTKRECEETVGFQRRWLEPILDKDTSYAEKILIDCDNKEFQVLTYCDELYPERLRNIPDPPAVLYYIGRLPRFDEEAVIGVIGTRNGSVYGMMQAMQFANLIATSGGIVVSGGAKGIDAMATNGALNSLMPTVCVLGSGLDVLYPRCNKEMFQNVIYHGCLISEYPPGTPPLAVNFPQRNRIISGLSLGVLVVEAPEKSGALITANYALEQGRDVFAVPANVGVKHSAGSNRLLREGATMVSDGWEVLSEYQHLFPDKLADGRCVQTMEKLHHKRCCDSMQVYSPVVIPHEPYDSFAAPLDKKELDKPPVKAYIDENDPQLTDNERTILSLFQAQPLHTDSLVARSKLPAQTVLSTLTILQIKRKVEKLSGNYYQRL